MISYRELLFDCEEYNGYKPCRYGNQCAGCVYYRQKSPPPQSVRWAPAPENLPSTPYRILIIKTGALGDVLRTTTLLPALHKSIPQARITWMTDQSALPLLDQTPLIHELVSIQSKQQVEAVLQGPGYHWLINLEKEQAPLELAAKVQAHRCTGFAPSPYGYPMAFDQLSEFGVLLGLDDELKFRKNSWSYPSIIARMCGLPEVPEPYVLELGAGARAARERFFRNLNDKKLVGKPIIGLNTGCGTVFQTKQWLIEHWIELAQRLVAEELGTVVLLGGPAEAERNQAILGAVPQLINGGWHLPLDEFIGVLDACDILVTSDTLGMHIGIARQLWVVALFGSTSATEIDLYGRGEKVMTDFPCAPCYKRTCDFDPWCMEKLLPSTVEAAVRRGVGAWQTWQLGQ